MQQDFHYYACYALARAAGLNADAATTIATSSQFVDDAIDREPIVNEGLGHRFQRVVTAHEMLDGENTDPDDQLMVWVPFHFLPGNEGETLSERLVCKPDSAIARAMVKHAVEECRRDFGLELVGVAAHVFADTFAHWGFSGVASRWNVIKPGSVRPSTKEREAEVSFGAHLGRLLAKLSESTDHLVENFRTSVARATNALVPLGHGAAVTCPDQPFLNWSFEYGMADGRNSLSCLRDNPSYFLTAAERLHWFFMEVAERLPRYADPTSRRMFSDIASTVDAIIRVVGDQEARAQAWREAVEAGALPGGTLPAYDKAVMETSGKRLASGRAGWDPLVEPLHRFFQAASLHQRFVLRYRVPASEVDTRGLDNPPAGGVEEAGHEAHAPSERDPRERPLRA